MRLEDFKEGKCPDSCVFEKREKPEERAWIPPPERELVGVLISKNYRLRHYDSKDPKFIDYKNDREEHFGVSIPCQLIGRIENFTKTNMKEEFDEDDLKCLSDIIYNNTYWTHLIKCFTDWNSDAKEHAYECANQWLKRELDYAITDGAKCIIALGNDVQGWIRDEWKNDEKNGVPVVGLPLGTRGFNRANGERTKTNIRELMKFCKNWKGKSITL